MKLLVVEDEPKTLEAIRQGLEESQFEVEVAYDSLPECLTSLSD